MINGGVNTHINITGNLIHHIGNRHYVVPLGTTSYGITGVFAGTGAGDIHFEGNIFHDIGRLATPGQSLTDYNHDHGLYLFNGPYTITNTIFYNNTAGWDIQLSPGSHDINVLNNTFAFPNPNQDGQIILWATGGVNTNIIIQNNIFYQPRNYAINSFQATEVNTLIDHNIIYGPGVAVVDLSSISGTIMVSGNNRTGTDPKITSIISPDFHLLEGSPAINAGVTEDLVPIDFDGILRPQGGAFDIGAYEYVNTAGPINGALLSAAKIYPNPWRKDRHEGKPVTFANLPQGSSIKLFTLSGHLMKTLDADASSVAWDLTNDGGDKIASGMYLYLISTSNGGQEQKLKGVLAVIR